jgi:thiol-disulfide isomerase/thioredoxin
MMNFKKAGYIIVFLYLVVNVTHSQTVLNVSVKDINGNITTIEDQAKGKIIVLDFWATLCKPCVKSIPKLTELSKKYSDSGVSFIGINEDSPRNQAKVKPLANSLGISYPVVFDTDQDIMSSLLVGSFPTLIIMDREENILFTHEGFVPGDEVIIEEELIMLID